jgi:homospermidine synthase
VADITAQIILAKAQSAPDLTNKANFLDSVAAGLWSLENSSGGIVTADDIGTIVRQYTDPSKTHWADYADSLADAFADSSVPVDTKLNAMATEVSEQAAAARK